MGEAVDVKKVEDDGGVAAKDGVIKSWLAGRAEETSVSDDTDHKGDNEA